MCVSVFRCSCRPTVSDPLGAGVGGSCSACCGYWELNSAPLQEQYVL